VSSGRQIAALLPRDDLWLIPPNRLPKRLACAVSERWLLRTDDGREIELVRREVTIAYRLPLVRSMRPWLARAGWGLGLIGVITATVAVAAGVFAPRRNMAASAVVDIPLVRGIRADVVAPVVVRTRYVTLPAMTKNVPDVGTLRVDPAAPRDIASALRRAFATNEAQDWEASSGSGIVVVGALQIERGRQCRDVAILTRDPVRGDRTANDRYCQTGHGPIAVEPDLPPATPSGSTE
jgi:hypothetical protein